MDAKITFVLITTVQTRPLCILNVSRCFLAYSDTWRNICGFVKISSFQKNPAYSGRGLGFDNKISW